MRLVNPHKFLIVGITVFIMSSILQARNEISQVNKQTNQYSLQITILSAQDGQPLPFATMHLKGMASRLSGIGDTEGSYTFQKVLLGHHELEVSYIGYQSKRITVDISRSTILKVFLNEASTTLQGVVVTASESKGLTSASTIDRRTLEHVQPSSFADVLALLPGNSTQTPNLTAGNVATLREVGISSSNYAVTAQGTQFVIDGAVQQQDANLQYVAQGFTQQDNSRNMVDYGLDMRTLTTDDIEKVEVIRGIPSVQYGDLTSGVIKITRRLEDTPLEARLKVDEFTKLLHVNKGLSWNNGQKVWQVDVGYLDSKADPRNPYETYQRLLISSRYKQDWNWGGNKIKWRIGADYRQTIDAEKEDPDIARQAEDKYKSSYAHFALNSELSWLGKRGQFIKEIHLQASSSYAKDKITRTKFVQLDRDRAAPIGYEAGEYDAVILPMSYTANLTVDGQPFTSNIDLRLRAEHHVGQVWNRWQLGLNWRYSKNYGEGQVYDPTRPINYSTSLRAFPYSDTPGKNLAAAYIENRMKWSMGQSRFTLQAGIRANGLLNLPDDYAMSGQWYLDPRVNMQWELPEIQIAQNPLQLDITAGFGKMTLLPSIHQLFPNKQYWDYDELNYYHANKEYRRIYVKTFIIDSTPYAIKPSTNKKWELRLGASYKENNLSVTYFKEHMNNGFRYENTPITLTYKKYDQSTIDGTILTGPPSLADLTYTDKTILAKQQILSNGTRVVKEGIEFQGSTRRISSLHTRITASGAWLRSTYTNSQSQWDNSYQDVVLNQTISDMYIAHYYWKSGYIKQRFNTNFTFDTYLEKLGFIISSTVECMWWSKQKDIVKSGTPYEYMDINGEVHPYTESSKQDIYLTHLIIPQSVITGGNGKEPFYALVNLKASKKFGQWIKLSLFVDRILDYTPDYKVGESTIRRSANPYFGMEIKFSL